MFPTPEDFPPMAAGGICGASRLLDMITFKEVLVLMSGRPIAEVAHDMDVIDGTWATG